jgi:hypothetical protein
VTAKADYFKTKKIIKMSKSKKNQTENKKEFIEIGDIWSHPKGQRGGKEMIFENQCEYCGKEVSGKSNTRYVHINTGGQILPNGMTDEDIADYEKQTGNQSQGCFAIGSECVKKVLGKNVETHSFFYE